MHINKITELLVLLCCELCLTIKVPIDWDDSEYSEVKNIQSDYVEVITPQNVKTLQQSQPIPTEYFQYTAQKPRFAVDIAAFHGVKNPQQHYKAYPIIPFTGKGKPVLGQHRLLDEKNTIYLPYQNYVQKIEETKNHVHPASSQYEVFHPYKAEEPALQELYKDPTLTKIRHDLEDSKSRLQSYEQEAGKPNIASDEYLESQEKTDRKLFPQKNVPAPYEIHRPERLPMYYRAPPKATHRDQILNQRFKHPWNQHNIKIRPIHYKPLKNHINHLRQHHAMKYDDERNEYPQIIQYENIEEPPEGYDIYEKGKEKYKHLRNNVDEVINKASQHNRPVVYQKLELQKTEPKPAEEEDEFIPVKNYAQVRKTETFKHLPRKAALDDAETYEEILNAPRLREAVKSTKAQTVYSEEGYEDSAYDHAGEQKHASDHEGHGGFLKEHEKSGGLYKIPSFVGSYEDGRGTEHRDKVEHGSKWKNNNENDEESSDAESFSENEYDDIVSGEIYNEKNPKGNNRDKREKKIDNGNTDIHETVTEHKDIKSTETEAQDRTDSEILDKNTRNFHETNHSQHEVDKRETNIKIPVIDFNSTYLTESEILKLAKEKNILIKDNIKEKYPYYFENIRTINKNSPLRYAENLKLIPKKSDGGTEFYDSRSQFECPEVDDDVDPVPHKLKTGKNPTEESGEEDADSEDGATNNKGENHFDSIKKQPRLNGLGDKIDCFKAKYFGENPLDSPFFKEELISNPEPISLIKLNNYKQLKKKIDNKNALNSDLKKIISLSELPKEDVRKESTLPQNLNIQSVNDAYVKKIPVLYMPQGTLATKSTQNTNVYIDILTNIKNNSKHSPVNLNIPVRLLDSNQDSLNATYDYFHNKEKVTKLPLQLRKKRASQFVYEPYKIIRDSQYQDSKKTTTTSNVSPLIKQLQSNPVVERVSRSNGANRHFKPTSDLTYVDMTERDRARINGNPVILDVKNDKRRGEPRYEVRPRNHKLTYTPVENITSVTVVDYKIRNPTKNVEDSTKPNETKTRSRGKQRYRQLTPIHIYHNVSSKSSKIKDIENAAASTTVKKIVTTTSPPQVSAEEKPHIEEPEYDSREVYNPDYEDEREFAGVEDASITTTTTSKPFFKRKLPNANLQIVTTQKPLRVNNDDPEKLKLVTWFPYDKNPDVSDEADKSTNLPVHKRRAQAHVEVPKYREKKKKSSKSTLVTDTKKYGDDDADKEDEMTTKEVDALIGVKEDMDEYTPSYEKTKKTKQDDDSEDDDDEEDNNDHSGGFDDDDDGDDDDDDDDENEDENEDEDEDEDEEEDNDEKDDDDDGDKKYDKEINHDVKNTKLEVTTSNPTKSTLVRTTNAPLPTDATYVYPMDSSFGEHKNTPIITRKKIEIHKELPANKSYPHTTQFKQDIKEEEIIKEIPPTSKRKPQKNVKLLEFYKDDNLAKDINTLSDVEVFDESIQGDSKPKHGGNYRKANKEDLMSLKLKSQDSTAKPPNDAIASQSSHLELDGYSPQKRNRNIINFTNDDKIYDLLQTILKARERNEKINNEKLIELSDDESIELSRRDLDDHKPSPHNKPQLHGGNYRSEKLIENKSKKNSDIITTDPAKEARRNAAVVLNNFVKAAPVLTTTPGYILDAGKRMYYYVDT